MPVVIEQIDKMNVEEKFATLDYIWSSISGCVTPSWHQQELLRTEKRVSEGLEHPVSWDKAKAILARMR